MNKKIILLVAALVFILTGCVKADFGMEINKDATGTAFFKYTMDKEKLAEFDEDPFADVQYAPELDGYDIRPYSDEKEEGVYGTRTFESVEEIHFTHQPGESFNIELEEGFFADKIVFNGIFDLTEDQSLAHHDAEVINSLDFEFVLTLPTKPSTHNATTVDGDALVWEIDLDGKTDIHAESLVIHWPIVISILVAGLVFISSLIVIIRKRKQNHEQ